MKHPATVVIVGGGFGGLEAAKKLGNRRGVEVILIDRRNYHLFQPLLYQVAMAGLSPAEIAMPIRGLLAKYKNIEVLLGNVESVNLNQREIVTDMGNFKYDYLILACGSKHSYFGRNDWEPLAPGLKTIEQATEIRRRILMAFEMAERETDPELRRQYLTFVVVGGGATGVELSGAIGEISHNTLSKDFRNIDPRQARILLIEAGPRILLSFSPGLSQKAEKSLAKLGVEVKTLCMVKDVLKDGVRIGDHIEKAGTVLWAAGVQPPSINKKLGTELDKKGRVIIGPDLSIPDFSSVFVIGDQANCKGKDGHSLPALAPVALQQGRHVAINILNDIKDCPRRTFKYVDKGQLAAIGRRCAVLEFGSLKLHGFVAWLFWLIVHIFYLIGFKNKLLVLIQWAWHYVNYGRGARLIVHKEWRSFIHDNKTD